MHDYMIFTENIAVQNWGNSFTNHLNSSNVNDLTYISDCRNDPVRYIYALVCGKLIFGYNYVLTNLIQGISGRVQTENTNEANW